MKDRKGWMRALFVAVLLLGLAAPAVAQIELNDSEEPGSVLVFHKFLKGTESVDLDSGLVLPKTEIEISVTCPKELGPNGCAEDPAKQDVFLRAHWVCPGNITLEGTTELEFQPICHEVNFSLATTVNGTIYFHPNGGGVLQPTNPFSPKYEDVDAAPCDQGYLIVWVVNDTGEPIKFDGLIGDAIVRHDDDTAGAYNALPIQASSGLQTYASTNVDSEGDLDFDGSEYKAITGKIFGTVMYEGAIKTTIDEVKTHLTLLTLDVRSNNFNNPTFVDLNFYNEDEKLKSTNWAFVCWTQVRLTTINSALDSNFGRKGLVKSTKAVKEPFQGINDTSGPVTLIGIVSTEVQHTSDKHEFSYSLFNDSEPVPTCFAPLGSNCALGNNNSAPPVNNGDPTITFDDRSGGQALDGEYPTGAVDWGTGAWYLSGPWGGFTTNSISFSGAGSTSESFTFVSPKTLLSVDAYNGGSSASTITISCTENPIVSVTVNANQLATISTGWTNACSIVTIGSTNGWETNFDNVKYQ